MEQDLEKFAKLSSDKKFSFVLEMIKREKVNSFRELEKAMKLLNWSQRNFIDAFKKLSRQNRLTRDDYDYLDSNDWRVRGPGIFSQDMIKRMKISDNYCNKVAPKNMHKFPICDDYAKDRDISMRADLKKLEIGQSVTANWKNTKEFQKAVKDLYNVWLDYEGVKVKDFMAEIEKQFRKTMPF